MACTAMHCQPAGGYSGCEAVLRARRSAVVVLVDKYNTDFLAWRKQVLNHVEDADNWQESAISFDCT